MRNHDVGLHPLAASLLRPRCRAFATPTGWASIRAATVIAVWLTSATTTIAQSLSPVTLDEFAGRWTIHSPSGERIGASTVDRLAEGAMLRETRTIGTAQPQLLWFSNFEAGGWRQLFVGALKRMREFATESAPGSWPLVLGATFATQDGRTTRFRMTIEPVANQLSRRVLESSVDAGSTWMTVFDYTYRRAG